MTPDTLAVIKEALSKTTPGPWTLESLIERALRKVETGEP